MAELSHFDADGKAHMVDVSDKDITERVATATARITMQPETLRLIMAGAVEKGDVLGIARTAGIMAAKKTAELIPLCHPLPLTSVTIDLAAKPDDNAVDISATCKVTARTGVEMEALTAASVAALTIYDMCKAVDRAMTISDVRLAYKAGGRSGTFQAT